MTAPSNANTSGLEVVDLNGLLHQAWERLHRSDADVPGALVVLNALHVALEAPLVTAASAQARIAELEAELEGARTIDASFWKWLGERDLQPDGPDVEWGDIVVALTEHESNAYDIADKANDRATAAEARADRLAKALEALQDLFAREGECSMERFERIAEMFRKDTGYLAPGKDPGMLSQQPEGDELRRIYDDWFAGKIKTARAALQQETQP